MPQYSLGRGNFAGFCRLSTASVFLGTCGAEGQKTGKIDLHSRIMGYV